MYIIQNAMSNVWRHRGRNLLLGAIILVVIAASVIALMISSTSGAIIADYKERFSSDVRFQPNMDKVREEAMAASTDGAVRMSMPTIDEQLYMELGESEHLADAVYTATTGVVPEGITTIDEAELGGGSGLMMAGPGAGVDTPEVMEYTASLRGGSFAEFEDGSRALADGDFPDALNEVIISTDLASEAALAIGDSMHLAGQLNDVEAGKSEDIAYDVTIVGTYDDLTDEYGQDRMQNAFTNTRNQILTTYDTVVQEYVADLRGMQISGTFSLKSPDLLEAFTAEARAKGLPEVFDVATDEAAYDQIVGPVEGLQSISLTFMILVLVFGGVTIALLTSIAIRERKYEIGVLRAMGMRKSAVSLGLGAEILAITAACTALGLVLGAVAAQPVSDLLLAGQIDAAENAAPEDGRMMMPGMGAMGGSAVDAEPLTELSVALTPIAIAQIGGVALLLAALAGAIALSRITKYEPMKILQERN